MARRTTTLDSINKRYGNRFNKITDQEVEKAVETYVRIGRKLANANVNINQIMGDEAKKLFPLLTPQHIGKLMLFFYDPKLKAKLPYYDRAPLIIPISVDNKGFLGINFHYLHPLLRAYLMDYLLATGEYGWFKAKDQREWDLFEKRRITLTYRKVQAAVRSGLYKPTIKRYLWKHVRSRFYMVDADDWMKFLPLPIERFEKSDKMTVWQKSLEQVYK